MYFEERERKEKEIKGKEREIQKKFQVLREWLLLTWEHRGDLGTFLV